MTSSVCRCSSTTRAARSRSAAAARSTICTTRGASHPHAASRTTSSTSSASSRDTVISNFVSEYTSGRTPIPCAHCNSDLKFSTLLDRARGLGSEHLATGHYARVEQTADGRFLLRRSAGPRQGSVVLPVLADAGSARARRVSGRDAYQAGSARRGSSTRVDGRRQGGQPGDLLRARRRLRDVRRVACRSCPARRDRQ